MRSSNNGFSYPAVKGMSAGKICLEKPMGRAEVVRLGVHGRLVFDQRRTGTVTIFRTVILGWRNKAAVLVLIGHRRDGIAVAPILRLLSDHLKRGK